MTLKDFEYWGKPVYTVVLENDIGHPIGIAYADGTINMIDPSKDSRVGTTTAAGDLITWDGACPDPSGGFSKGRLLPVVGPPYVDSLTVFKHLARPNKEDKENAKIKARTRGNEPRKA